MAAGAGIWELRAYILNHKQETEKTRVGKRLLKLNQILLQCCPYSNEALSSKPP